MSGLYSWGLLGVGATLLYFLGRYLFDKLSQKAEQSGQDKVVNELNQATIAANAAANQELMRHADTSDTQNALANATFFTNPTGGVQSNNTSCRTD